jgi:hypothetical protein
MKARMLLAALVAALALTAGADATDGTSTSFATVTVGPDTTAVQVGGAIPSTKITVNLRWEAADGTDLMQWSLYALANASGGDTWSWPFGYRQVEQWSLSHKTYDHVDWTVSGTSR